MLSDLRNHFLISASAVYFILFTFIYSQWLFVRRPLSKQRLRKLIWLKETAIIIWISKSHQLQRNPMKSSDSRTNSKIIQVAVRVPYE